MNIKLAGNGVEEDKVVFEKLLAKWDELFTRETIFDGMELVETGIDGTVIFTNEDTELTFYQTESDKANKSDPMFSAEKVTGALKSMMITMKSLDNDSARKKWDELKKRAVIVTKIVYEIDGEKQISFVFSKFIDSNANDVILHIEFGDDSNDTQLQAKVIAVSEEGSEITLNALLKALDKEEIYVHFENFISKIAEHKKELQDKIKTESEKEKLEKLQPAFDALDKL